MAWGELFDSISRFMDPVFGTNLISLIIYSYLPRSKRHPDDPIQVTPLNAHRHPHHLLLLVLLHYFIAYSFFALILYGTIIGKTIVYKYLGFLQGTFYKGLFYIL